MGNIDYFSFQRVAEYFPQLLSRLHITLIITVLSLVIGLLLGTLIAAVRLFNIPVLKQITTVYISFIRGVPINIQLFIVYFGLPALLNPVFLRFNIDLNMLDAFSFVVATYAFNSAAFLSVVVTAAIQGVDKGQLEGARSIGMTRGQMFMRVVFPQAFHIAIPEFGNTVISTLKDTSLAFTVGVVDMVGVISSIAARTRHSLEGYVGAAIIYFAFCIVLEKGFSALEKKLQVYK
ncbi:amino acid ABC transporter permease [Anaerocolumna xylanovorans]|uniref:L-cystine transport system permease protein n=1 Tax=Anaerocolumna xylanovorans DSM 12503 TaxID=1121345 RepID=A0A1M7XWY0_9FIRM|nr:amino acid ABC transporter permease [Anaerocolumna xylanovorans]SHO43318.1 L-cystine transport system permease protein [Anaerocolumna xylanovorans DSM 12503]